MIPYPKFLESDLRNKIKNYMQIEKKKCLVCHGTGTIPDYENDREIWCPACHSKLQRIKTYLMSNVGYEYVHISEKDIEANLTKDTVDNYRLVKASLRQEFTEGHFLITKYPDDKSYGTSTIGNLLIKDLIDCGWQSIIMPMAQVQELIFGFDRDKESKDKLSELKSFMRNIPVLMIDELGTETRNEFVRNELRSALNLRKNTGKITILVSELPIDKLHAAYKDDQLLPFMIKTFVNLQIRSKEKRVGQTANDKFKLKHPEFGEIKIEPPAPPAPPINTETKPKEPIEEEILKEEPKTNKKKSDYKKSNRKKSESDVDDIPR